MPHTFQPFTFLLIDILISWMTSSRKGERWECERRWVRVCVCTLAAGFNLPCFFARKWWSKFSASLSLCRGLIMDFPLFVSACGLGDPNFWSVYSIGLFDVFSDPSCDEEKSVGGHWILNKKKKKKVQQCSLFWANERLMENNRMGGLTLFPNCPCHRLTIEI